MPQTRTLEEIRRDFQRYKDLSKRQGAVTLYAEKYVEDLGIILDLLDAKTEKAQVAESQVAEAPKSRKPRALKND